MKVKDVLDLEFHDSQADTWYTVRGYLQAQLLALWSEADSFSGKRPLGYSDWLGIFDDVFVKNGLLPEEWQAEDYESLVKKCIYAL